MLAFLDQVFGILLAILLVLLVIWLFILAGQALSRHAPRAAEWLDRPPDALGPLVPLLFFGVLGGGFVIWIYLMLLVFGGDSQVRFSQAFARAAGLFAGLGASPVMAQLGSAVSFVALVLVPAVAGWLQLAEYLRARSKPKDPS
jgi:hypothetical protein